MGFKNPSKMSKRDIVSLFNPTMNNLNPPQETLLRKDKKFWNSLINSTHDLHFHWPCVRYTGPLHGSQACPGKGACITHWSSEPCCTGPSKTDGVKWKRPSVVDVSGGKSKVWCCKEQYSICIGTWSVRSTNQGKLAVVKQEMSTLTS